MKWKSKGRTPAGHRCEVLTLDGSEEMLVGEKSVELPSKNDQGNVAAPLH